MTRFHIFYRSVNLVKWIKSDQAVKGESPHKKGDRLPLEACPIWFDEEQATVKLLEARIASADERTAQKLDIQVGERTVYIRRLIYQGADPLLLHREHVIYNPTRPLVEAELEITALSGLFTGGGGLALKWGDLTIDATVLTREEAVLLNAGTSDPALRLEHIFYDFDTRPVSWGWFICPGNHLRFTATVGVPDEERTVS